MHLFHIKLYISYYTFIYTFIIYYILFVIENYDLSLITMFKYILISILIHLARFSFTRIKSTH